MHPALSRPLQPQRRRVRPTVELLERRDVVSENLRTAMALSGLAHAAAAAQAVPLLPPPP